MNNGPDNTKPTEDFLNKHEAAPAGWSGSYDEWKLKTASINTDPRRSVSAGDIFRHFKGTLYYVYGFAVYTETEDTLVLYYALDDIGEEDKKVWARPLSMFLSKVDKKKYPDVEQEYRFEYIDHISPML